MMVQVKNSSNVVIITYGRDALHRHVTDTVGSSVTDRFFSQDWQLLENKAGSNTVTRNVWSPGYVDALVLRDRDTDSNGTLDERLYSLQDANWNTTGLVNSSGSVQERYTYSPFGVVTFRDASGSALSGSSKDWVFLHQGGEKIAAGDYEFRNRVYSPTLGRWLSIDPLGFEAGDVNTFRSSANSPGNYNDPSGLILPIPLIAIGGAFGIIFLEPILFPPSAPSVQAPTNPTDIILPTPNPFGTVSSALVGIGAVGAAEAAIAERTLIPLIEFGIDYPLPGRPGVKYLPPTKVPSKPPSGSGGPSTPPTKPPSGGPHVPPTKPDTPEIGQPVLPPSKVHGNTAGTQPATLYEKYDADGIFLKHGISQNPSKRYTQKELNGGYLIETQTGPRNELLKIERDLVERFPGPQNKEPWAGKRRGK
jgi:RHS repeat-associated protein